MENKYFFSILIYIFIPLIVLWYYTRLVNKMKAEMVESPPTFSLFLVLMSYTIILLVTFSPLYIISHEYVIITLCYSYIIAPIVMVFVAAVNHGKRHFSRFHSGVYKASLVYLLVAPMSVAIWIYLLWG